MNGSLSIGVLSDTHGRLNEATLKALHGCDRILHAGDVGAPEVLERLAELAPTSAVRGNVDTQPPLSALPEQIHEALDPTGTNPVAFTLCHYREELPTPPTGTAGLFVFGHSHAPEVVFRGKQLWLNPGACGQRRFSLPLTVARVKLEGQRFVPELVAVE